jgi:hypothetical protein
MMKKENILLWRQSGMNVVVILLTEKIIDEVA